MSTLLLASPVRCTQGRGFSAFIDESDPDDDTGEIIGEQMTSEERQYLHRMRGDREYSSLPTTDPIQERFGDDQLAMLSPFFGNSIVPDASQLESILTTHPMRSCRPGMPRYTMMLDTLIQLCQLRGKGWRYLALEASKRRGDLPL